MDFIIRLFIDGGQMMWIISGLLLIALIIVLERSYFLFIKANVNADKFMTKIYGYYKEKKINEALTLCSKMNKPLTKLVEAAIRNHESMDKEIQDAVDEAFLAEAPKLKKLTPLLAVISQIATILGLLGTIVGLMDAFDALAGVNPALRTEALAAGISKAMSTTAFGLMVAGICIFAYAVLNSQMERLIDDIDEYSVKILNYIKKY